MTKLKNSKNWIDTNYENFCLLLKKNNNTGINNDILQTFGFKTRKTKY